MADEIRRLSDELARDPSSLVFIPLGDALRKQGQAALALKVALRGLERHPHSAEAHDLLARIAVDSGELDRAFDEWDMALRLSPEHAGAKKGMGFVRFRQGRLAEAEEYLAAAAEADPDDASITTALVFVRESLHGPSAPAAEPAPAPRYVPPEPRRAEAAPAIDAEPLPDEPAPSVAPAQSAEREARRESQPDAPRRETPRHTASGAMSAEAARRLFAEDIGEGEQTALLLDASGLVLAGVYIGADGADVSQEIGAELSGVSDEASRAMRHLELGAWQAIIFETGVATVAMTPAPQDALLLVAASRATPLGLVRRLMDRAGARAREWMGGAS